MPAEPELHRIRCDTRRLGSRAILGKAIAMMRMPLIKLRKIEIIEACTIAKSRKRQHRPVDRSELPMAADE